MDAKANSDSPAETVSGVIGRYGQPELGQDIVLGPTKEFWFIPIPKRLRYDSSRPFPFGITMSVVFGIISTFSVANLYYCQPILIDLANAFNVTYEEVSVIPTLVQAGYAIGLLLISPLGDLVRRRQLILLLLFISATLTIGIALSNNHVTFEVVSFFVGVITVVPQILVPLAADLAPPERRATAVSIVLSGLLFGILIARVLAGVVTQFTSWRVVFYVSIGVQYGILFTSYLTIPDYPAKNVGLTYWQILWTMAKFCVTEPVLIQACLITFASCACYANFWVTLTFLLGEDPYNYSTLVIGLFGLIGMVGVAMSPAVGRFIDMLVPWYSCLLSIIFLSVFGAIQVGAGGINVAAVIIVTIGLDVFRQMTQVSLTTNVFSIAPEARARLNAILILSLFIGQVMGTSAGTKVFIQHGWRAAAWVNLAWYGWQLFILLLRGPHCQRFTWFGYEGGVEWRKRVAKGEGTTDEKNKVVDVENGPPVTEGNKIETDTH